MNNQLTTLIEWMEKSFTTSFLGTNTTAQIIAKAKELQSKDEDGWISVEEIKEAFSEYFASEGCGCCSNSEKHGIAENKIGKLLNYPRYKDDSGYDFSLPNKPKQTK